MSSQYVLGMMISAEICFIGELLHCEPNYLVLKDAYVVGIKSKKLEDINSEEDIFEVLENMIIEPLSECNDNLVVSSDYYIMTISEESYNKTKGAEWTLPQPDTD